MTDPDPRGLIAEAYAIDDITEAQCRTIFLNWAVTAGDTGASAIQALLDRHTTPDHPMSRILREAAQTGVVPRRRGGRAARLDG
ncbi:hypothetical protein ACMU_17810 [Actibacterium mucosum KCTC 23349]|uniref:Uncharacterized protein n=1 Tax=Actibacterium mucosum KCTC 23349 TaxID=1454373 RepID=A0A037ZG20_9RHOB|nr:hypothetical protein [Actibacterium mucosum]KAJ54563.1 hypothetical protein ACMU_17810 [Actibacterium mucosum KCTC 23349]